MRKRNISQAIALSLCLVVVSAHSLYLLINSDMKSFLMCGVFACYLMFAVAKNFGETSHDEVE
ncbi:hypothetical protein EON83_19630 [bacterium]|nr:MAG: hypothetical protein EON83_19630 [bacterium]